MKGIDRGRVWNFGRAVDVFVRLVNYPPNSEEKHTQIVKQKSDHALILSTTKEKDPGIR